MNIYGSLMDIFDLKNIFARYPLQSPKHFIHKKERIGNFMGRNFQSVLYIYYRCGLALIFFCEGV